ncbi:MAG TPA: CHRD domain-containing protein, partial [Actinomycetota bacterium]|nr:CHRD domain-containing protein [Actinomycetota bacterium]
TARIRLRRAERRVCWRLTWENISTPQAAHIHKGKKDENGDVVVNLFLTPQEGSEASGCEEGVSRRLIRRIKNRPRNFYVNVHTEDFPAGAIRGQLHR